MAVSPSNGAGVATPTPEAGLLAELVWSESDWLLRSGGLLLRSMPPNFEASWARTFSIPLRRSSIRSIFFSLARSVTFLEVACRSVLFFGDVNPLSLSLLHGCSRHTSFYGQPLICMEVYRIRKSQLRLDWEQKIRLLFRGTRFR